MQTRSKIISEKKFFTLDALIEVLKKVKKHAGSGEVGLYVYDRGVGGEGGREI